MLCCRSSPRPPSPQSLAKNPSGDGDIGDGKGGGWIGRSTVPEPQEEQPKSSSRSSTSSGREGQISCSVQHASLLDSAALRLRKNTEHIALSGFSQKELAQLLREIEEEKEKDKSAAEPEASNEDRWTVLAYADELALLDSLEAAFVWACVENPGRNVHWIHKSEDALRWRATHGDPSALESYVRPLSDACARPYAPTCVHARLGAEDVEGWRGRLVFLLGEPGLGRTGFMERVAQDAPGSKSNHWSVVVRLADHADRLDGLPEPENLTVEHAVELLAAAAGVAAPTLSAALHSGGVDVFVAGLCRPSTRRQEKVQRLLDRLLLETSAAHVWVASRPQSVSLPSDGLLLLPLSPSQQLSYLTTQWSSTLNAAPESLEPLAKQVVSAFSRSLSDRKRLLSANEILKVPETLAQEISKDIQPSNSLTSDELTLFIKKVHEAFQTVVTKRDAECIFTFDEFLPLVKETVEELASSFRESENERIVSILDQRKQDVATEIVKTLSSDVNQWSLLGAPLHLRMAAEVFVSKISSTLNSGGKLLEGSINQLELYRQFMDLQREKFNEQHQLATSNSEGTSGHGTEIFDNMHRNYAMLLWTSILQDFDRRPLEEAARNYEKYLSKDRTGVIWQLENEQPQFAHALIMKYFVADWIFNNRNSSEAKLIVRNVFQSQANSSLLYLLDLMFSEGHELHEAVLNDNVDALKAALAAGIQVDELDAGGRSALHLAAWHGRIAAVGELLAAGAGLQRVDSLLGWTALQYADAALELEAAERLLKTGADIAQVVAIVEAAAAAKDLQLPVRAVRHNLIEIMKLLLKSGAGQVILNACREETIEENDLKTEQEESEGNGPKAEREESEGSSPKTEREESEENGPKTEPEEINEDNPKTERESIRDNEKIYRIHLQRNLLVTPTLTCHQIQNKNTNVTKVQIKKLDVICSDARHFNLLQIATHKGFDEMVKLLVEAAKEEDANRQAIELKPMHIAASKGHISLMKMLLDIGADIHACDPVLNTPLHTASMTGHIEIVELLISRGADVGRTAETNQTALLAAAHSGHLRVVEVLLDAGADVNSSDVRSITPLHAAVQEGHAGVVELLLSRGADPHKVQCIGQTAMHIAAYENSTRLVEILVTAGADIHAFDQHHFTPLHIAVQEGHAELVKRLVSLGVDVNNRDEEHDAAIHVAIRCGHVDITKTLLDAGADINSGDADDKTPLYLASMSDLASRADMVELLISRGADVNRTALMNVTALHAASFRGDVRIGEMLLNAGANINAFDDRVMTPLYVAVQNGREEMVKLLLSRGASFHQGDLSGAKPIHSAALEGYVSIAAILLDAGADVNAGESLERTPLHLAAHQGHSEVVKLLISRGADVNATSIQEEQAVQLATLEGHIHVIEILLKNGADVHSPNMQFLTLLHIAAQNGNADIVELLLSKGADVKRMACNGQTAISNAIAHGHVHIVEMLLDAGAEVNPQILMYHSPLHLAVFRGHAEIVKLLLRRGADLSQAEAMGHTVIHNAAAKGHTHILEILLDAGGDVNVLCHQKFTPLHVAVQNDHVDAVRLLLSRGADLKSTNVVGQTPLHIATLSGQRDIIAILLDGGAEINSLGTGVPSPLHMAVHNRHTDVVKFLLSRGADVNVKAELGDQPIHEAARLGDTDLVKILLEAGADVTSPGLKRPCPLFLAAQGGHTEVVHIILSAGADPNTAADDGFSAIHYAALRGHVDVVKALLDAGVDVDVCSASEHTPLHCAVQEGHEDVVKLLLSLGADINRENRSGKAPMHVAAILGHPGVLGLLLDAGADINVPDALNIVPLLCAAAAGQTSTVRCLITRGADIHSRNPLGQTALHMAAYTGHDNVVRVLLELGADVDVVDYAGDPALDGATFMGHKDVIKVLQVATEAKHPKATIVELDDDEDESKALPPVDQ